MGLTRRREGLDGRGRGGEDGVLGARRQEGFWTTDFTDGHGWFLRWEGLGIRDLKFEI